MKVFPADLPFPPPDGTLPPYADRPAWPGCWLDFDGEAAVFRLRFRLERARRPRVHFSFDEGGELWLDGALVERGPYRSAPRHWPLMAHDLELAAGEHEFLARAWALGRRAPWGQMSSGAPGFLLAVAGDMCAAFSTGLAPWEISPLAGLAFSLRENDLHVKATGAVNHFDFTRLGDYAWRPAERGRAVFSAAAALHFDAASYLEPCSLPPQRDEPYVPERAEVALTGAWPGVSEPFSDFRFADDRCDPAPRFDRFEGISVPAGGECFALVDFHDYAAFHYEVVARGRGGCISVEFAEALFDGPDGGKRARAARRGQYWRQPRGDLFHTADASRTPAPARPVFWRCGRFMLLRLRAGDEPLVLERLAFRRTGYPLALGASFRPEPDPGLSGLATAMKRTLALCVYDYPVDCPYYEQLMYAGDARVENLMLHAVDGDDRPAWRARELFDRSRDATGLTAACYPARGRKCIPPYSLLHLASLRDGAFWSRRDAAYVRRFLPGARGVIDAWEQGRDAASGLVRSPRGWNFVDAGPGRADGWGDGVPPGGTPGEISGVLNLLYAYVLGYAMELESWCGDRFLADRYAHLRDETRSALRRHCYAADHGLFADAPGRNLYSEHAQILALLGGIAGGEGGDGGAALFDPAVPLARAGAYFSHYYFECCRLHGRMDRFFERLAPLGALVADDGLLTTPEDLENPRSDCHAWSASALFHFYATLAGIRPAAPGFRAVRVRPQPGPLSRIAGEMPHPDGTIRFDFRRGAAGRLSGELTLPPGVSGLLSINGEDIDIVPGRESDNPRIVIA